MPAGKTPGEVAYEAYHFPYPGNWRGYGDHGKAAWEKAAQAVRKQAGEEIQASEGKPATIITQAVMDMQRVSDIRAVLASYGSNHTKVMGEWVYMDANEVIEEIEGLLASPKPEAAEACAEGAGAEPSQSPPPAER